MKKYDVLAVGELNADLIFTGLNTMPVPGREIIAKDMKLTLGSSTAICASGLSRLGLKVGFVGKIGKDIYADIIRSELIRNNLDVTHIIEDDSISTGLTLSLSTRKDRALVSYLGSIEALKPEDVDTSLFDDARHIHVGSFFLQNALRPGLAGLLQEAKRRGATTSLDAGWDDTGCWDYGIREVLTYTDVFLPNETEALHITRKETVEEAAEELSRFCRVVVIKMGPQGAYMRSGDMILKKMPYEVVPVDTTGAGDSFNAGFLYGFINGLGFEKAMDYGNACGSVCVTRVGGATACASLDDVNELINNSAR